MRSLRSHATIIADLALAILVCWIASAVYLSHYGVGNALSSDNLMPYVLYDDLFHRKLPLAGFYWPESPFYFPDLLVAWLLYALSGSLLTAVSAYAWVNSLIFVLLARAVLFRASVASAAGARIAWFVFLCLWLAIGLIGLRGGIGWFGQFYGGIFVPNNHSGALLGVMAGTAILLGDKRRAGPGSCIALTLLSAVVLVSDRLFEIQFMLPAIVFCVWRFGRERVPWFAYLALLLAALLIGSETLRLLFPSDTMKAVAELAGANPALQIGGDPNMRVSAAESLARMAADVRELTRNDALTTTLELIVLAVGLWLLVGATVWPRSAVAPQASANRRLMAALVFAIALAPIIASIVLGRHIAMHAFRYCQTIVLLLLPACIQIATLITSRIREPGRIGWASGGVVAISTLAIPFFIDATRSALYAHERDQEKCLRDTAEQNHLKFGVAEYWHALEMTARFPQAPVIAPLSKDAGPRMSMMTNVGWFGALADDAAQIPTLDFVDEESYPPPMLDQVYGKPLRTVACPRSAYRIYRPEDGALSRMYRHFDWMPGQVVRRVGRITLPAAAWAADETYVQGDALRASGDFANSTPILITAQDFPAGQPQIRLTYSLALNGPAAAARWDVSDLDEDGNPASVIGKGELPANTQQQQIDLPLGSRSAAHPGMGISVHVSGPVDLRLSAIEIRLGHAD